MINTPLHFIIIGITVVVSFLAFSNEGLRNKLILNPYIMKRKNEFFRLLTSGFIHADIGHLAFNMITFYFFAPVVLSYFAYYFGANGTLLFIALYLGAMALGSLPDYFTYQDQPHYNALGASGGVSGVVMASILMEPLNKLYLMFIPIGIPGFIFGILYLLYSYYQSRNANDNIGHRAHLWGAVFGIVFTALLRPAFIGEFAAKISQWSIF